MAEVINEDKTKKLLGIQQESSIAPLPEGPDLVYVNITDDVDDEATHGRRRQRNKGMGDRIQSRIIKFASLFPNSKGVISFFL